MAHDEARPDLIGVEEFLAPPERSGASISPDGTRIAYLAPWKNRPNVWVQDLDDAGGLGEPRCVTADERPVTDYRWTHDPRWMLYLQDDDGDENRHVLRIDLDRAGGDDPAPAVDLTPYPDARVIDLELPQGRPGVAVVQINHRDPAAFDLCELDLTSGELRILARNPGRIDGWLPTVAGEVYAMTTRPDGDLELVQVDEDGRPCRTVTVLDGRDYVVGPHPLRVTPDGTGLWVGAYRGTDHLGLVRIDLATGERTEVDSHPELDLDQRPQVFPTVPSTLITDRATGDLIGLRYSGERQVIHPLTVPFASVLARLEALSDGDVGPLSSDADGRWWIVAFTHDRDPGVTWLYDHATGTARTLFRRREDHDPEAMAPMTPVTITARDGLALPSYLTLPVGVEPTGLPMVLMVHGGPWTRDAWGFDPGVQFFAHRGYAVLQVNFRGSAGFGRTHLEAAIGELAGKMHDDLADAVAWAVDQGHADPDRVAIFGGSYGGYASLVGVTFTPDLFAAAVDYVGISNLVSFIRSQPAFVRHQLAGNWLRYGGDPDDPEQEADLLARSPLTHAEKITTPLMVFQGANDARVPQAESDAIVASLRDRGVDVDYRVFADEGHLFVNPDNVVDMFRASAEFFATHLGGRA